MGANSEVNKAVILFDGVCNLCNSSVDFVMNRDVNDKFLFASLQSSFAENQPLLRKHQPKDLDSIILLKGQNVFDKSSAVLRIAKELKGGWPILYIFIVIPKAIRDGIYDWVASNRYKWFGKSDTCRVPTKKEQAKFIDNLEVAS